MLRLVTLARFLAPVLLAGCHLAPPAARTEAPPNFVLIFLDDAGWGDFASYGNPVIRTPRLDRMAREGTRFTQFYAASPACSASRYALLTGRVGARSGLPWVLVPNGARGLHPAEVTLAEALHDAGYATACFGKWHLGRPAEFLPPAHGFDEYLGIPYSNDMLPPRWPPLPLLRGSEVVAEGTDQATFTRRFTEAAVEFIRGHRERPFFVYLPHPMPHVPLHPGPAFAGGSRRGTYGDVIEELDWSVGRILDVLREEGLDRSTLVLLTSDNGPWILKGREGGSAGPLRDGKGSTWEGGVREPAIAWWPGRVPAGRVERRVASTLDVLPTFLRLAGVPPPADRELDGTDITPLLLGEEGGWSRPPLFLYGPGNRLQAVRDGPWKLHLRTNSQVGARPFEGRLPLLFHLEHDPGETVDLAAGHPEEVARLRALADAQEASVKAEGSFWSRQPRPNVLLIVADDMGWGDLGCFGGDLETPRLDALAAAGARCTDFTVTAPVCTPSRYSLLTGRYPWRARGGLDQVGMMFDESHQEHGLREGEVTIAELLHGAGYRTALVGKWHLGHGRLEFLPTRHGFDHFLGIAGGCADYFTHRYAFVADWWRGEERVEEKGYATDLMAEDAVRWLQEDAAAGDGRPFFLMLSFTAPHYGKSVLDDPPPEGETLVTRKAGGLRLDPESRRKVQPVNTLQATAADLAACAGIADPKRRHYAAMVRALDRGVGETLDALEGAGLARNTLVIFLADNGPDTTPSSAGDPGPWRGGKHTLWEGGVRVPCILRWPGRLEAGSEVSSPVSSLDLLPTLCALAGASTGGLELDGLDAGPALFQGERLPARTLLWRHGRSRAARQGRWKWLDGRLYDLESDPGETTDVAADHPKVARFLEASGG